MNTCLANLSGVSRHLARRHGSIAMRRDEYQDAQLAMLTLGPQGEDVFGRQEWLALQALRRQYSEGQDLWDVRELAHLRFCRWLREAGRLES